MSILINKDTKVITQGITGKTGQFHTRMCRDYANGKNCFVAGVNPKKAGEDFEGIPIYASVKDAKQSTGATVSVIYVPPAGAAAGRVAVSQQPVGKFEQVFPCGRTAVELDQQLRHLQHEIGVGLRVAPRILGRHARAAVV